MDESTCPEQWRAVPGFEGYYQVSNYGRVWSCSRKHSPRGRFMKTPPTTGGYSQLNLRVNGTTVHTAVHLLVMRAFGGLCPPGLETRHLDGDPSNNRLDNLVYGSHSENAFDMVRHGTHNHASKIHCKAGHPLTTENTYPDSSGSGFRRCKSCQSERYYQRRGVPVRPRQLYMSQRRRCPRNHLLQEPNLVNATRLLGKRACLSCNRARSVIQHARKMDRQYPDLQALSDTYYAALSMDGDNNSADSLNRDT